MSFTRYFRTGDGCGVAYRLDGVEDQRPVLMLSNSIATNLHMWDGQVAELAESYRVLRYDTRGHGESASPAGAYSIDRLGRDVLELLDSLQISRVHFCGLSLGGFVGQWLGVAIAAAIPGAELVLLPGVHMLNVERPAEFMGAVKRFLRADLASGRAR